MNCLRVGVDKDVAMSRAWFVLLVIACALFAAPTAAEAATPPNDDFATATVRTGRVRRPERLVPLRPHEHRLDRAVGLLGLGGPVRLHGQHRRDDRAGRDD